MSRRRPAMWPSRASASPGVSRTIRRKAGAGRRPATSGVAATRLAERSPPSIAAISPNTSPSRMSA